MFHSFCQNITIPLPGSWETDDTASVVTWWSELKLNISLGSKIRVWGGHRAPEMWSYEECVRWPTLEPRTSYNSIESLVLVIFSPRTIISDASNKYSTMSTISMTTMFLNYYLTPGKLIDLWRRNIFVSAINDIWSVAQFGKWVVGRLLADFNLSTVIIFWKWFSFCCSLVVESHEEKQ